MAEGLGNDVNMMPGFMVTGTSCFGMPYCAVVAGWVEIPKASDEWMPYCAVVAGWVEIPKASDEWLEIRPVKASIKYAEVKNAT